MDKKIAAVVVTFNRLDLLKKVIKSLKEQTRKPDEIIVVNNSSTDGTEEWLKEVDGISVVKQDNLGSSGGQYTAFKTAYGKGYDLIWGMDDDVVPEKDCLETLLKYYKNEKMILAPLRFDLKGEPFINDTIKFNLTNPFKSLWTKIIDKDLIKNDLVRAEGITFEGPLFHRSLIEKKGLPEKNFFIYGDDSEYFIRANKAGFETYVVTPAKLVRQLPAPDLNKEFSWKHYYIIRNLIAIDKLHGNFFVRTLRKWFYLLIWYRRAKTEESKKTVIKAFKDGLKYRSGN